MHIGTLEELNRVLQASISPVALISGVGLLILSMTNRFGRVTDRLRELASRREDDAKPDQLVATQVEVLLTRARVLRMAVSFAVASVLGASVIVLAVFGMAVLDLRLQTAVICLFAISLICLIIALLLFMYDMHLSLQAVQAELRQ